MSSSISLASTKTDTIAGVSDATIAGIKRSKTTGQAKPAGRTVVPQTIAHNYDQIGQGVETPADAPYGPDAYAGGDSGSNGLDALSELLEAILATAKDGNKTLDKIADRIGQRPSFISR